MAGKAPKKSGKSSAKKEKSSAKLYSMTGFASHTAIAEDMEFSCEIRSLNSRYLETFIKLPSALRPFEDDVKERIRAHIQRGKINCQLTVNAQSSLVKVNQLDEKVISRYKQMLDHVRDLTGIEKPVEIADLLVFKDDFMVAEEAAVDEVIREAMLSMVTDTIKKLNASRASEGSNLQNDLFQRLKIITELTAEVAEMSKGNARAEFDKLHQRLKSMIDEQKIDRNRLEMELALISDRVDISEEVVRMHSHLELFEANLRKGSPIGKKLNFILQEMHREANTMSAKCSLVDISHRIVTIKEEIERMREQIQNIE